MKAKIEEIFDLVYFSTVAVDADQRQVILSGLVEL